MSTPEPFAGASLTGLPMPPDGPCRCPDCKYRQGPRETGKDALLYYGPGITDRTWRARVRNGQWDDIPAEFDAAHARVHLPAVKASRHIRRDLSNGQDHLAAVFSVHPDWLSDAEVAEGLHAAEVSLAAGLAEMRRAAAERWAESRVAA